MRLSRVLPRTGRPPLLWPAGRVLRGSSTMTTQPKAGHAADAAEGGSSLNPQYHTMLKDGESLVIRVTGHVVAPEAQTSVTKQPPCGAAPARPLRPCLEADQRVLRGLGYGLLLSLPCWAVLLWLWL